MIKFVYFPTTIREAGATQSMAQGKAQKTNTNGQQSKAICSSPRELKHIALRHSGVCFFGSQRADDFFWFFSFFFPSLKTQDSQSTG